MAVASALLLSACGRIGFEELARGGDARGADGSDAGSSAELDGSLMPGKPDAGSVNREGGADDARVDASFDAGMSTVLDASAVPVRVAEPIGAGFSESCAVRNGELWCWGEVTADAGAPSCAAPFAQAQVGNENDWASVSQTADHVCALRTDGRLFCWGKNDSGQLGVGDVQPRVDPTAVSPSERFQRVSAGVTHTCAIRSDDSLWCWGDNSQREVDDAATALYDSPVHVSPDLTFLTVSAGRDMTCAIDTAQRLWCWGANDSGQAGQPGLTIVSPLAQVEIGRRFRAVASHRHTCAIDDGGALYCFGNAESGKLGTGSLTNTSIPTRVGSASTWSSIDVEYSTTCGIDAGQVVCWGRDSNVGIAGGGIHDTPNILDAQTDWEHVAIGDHVLCAVRAGNVHCRGRNDFCQVSANEMPGALVQSFVPLF